MPRIRSLKPEHRSHRKIGPLSDRAYRLWVGMLLEADDAGRLVCDTSQLRAVIFAYHPKVSATMIEAALRELTESGLVRTYHANGGRYACFPSWQDHQRIDHPRRSPLPEPSFQPDNGNPANINDSPKPREDSRSFANVLTGSDVIGSDRIGRDQGSEGMAPDSPKPRESVRASVRAAAVAIIAFLNRKTDHRYPANSVNLGLVMARLGEGATPDQCRSVIACKARQWRGDPKMHPFLRPKTLFGKTNFSQYLGELPAEAFMPEESADD